MIEEVIERRKKGGQMYRHFYQFLNAQEKLAYNVIYEGAKKYQKGFNVPLLNVDIDKTMRALIYDCPELYFINNDALSYTKDKIWFNNDYCLSHDQIKKYDAELEKIVMKIKEKITKSMNAFDVELLIYNYLMESTVFFEEYLDKGQYKNPESNVWDYHTLIGPLIHRKGICGGINRAMQYLLLKVGFEVIYVEGQSFMETTQYEKKLPDNHSWVIIKVDGGYYHLDLSHGICDRMNYLKNGVKLLSYKYFNLTDKEIAKTHFYDKERLMHITCSETKYNYFVYKNIFFKEEQSLNNYLQTVIIRGIANERDVEIYIKHTDNISSSRIKEMLISIYRAAGKKQVTAAVASGGNIFAAYLYNKAI